MRLIARQLHCDVRDAVDDITSGGASFVTVMQAADFPKRDHVTLGDALHASGRWRVFRQREMRARSVIVRKVESGLGGLGDAQPAGALYLLRVLFPPLNGLFGNTSYGAEWEATWRAEQQVTAPGYFRRYFQYAVPARDT